MSVKRLIVAVSIAAAVMFIGCAQDEAPVPEAAAPAQKTVDTPTDGDWLLLSGDPSLSAWTMQSDGAWKVVDGVMEKSEGGGYLWTKERFGNFILDCEFKISKDGNSGIFFRTDDVDDPVQKGIEMQVYNIERKPSPVKNDCGAVYDFKEPSVYADKPAGEWNHVILTCDDNMITVVLNDVKIVEMDVNEWDTPGMNPDGTKNKFNTALKDFKRDGHIGFQEHGDPVWYRNVKIKRL